MRVGGHPQGTAALQTSSPLLTARVGQTSGRKQEVQGPILTAFLLAAFPSSSLPGSSGMQEALCRGSALCQPLQREAAEIPGRFYSTSLFLFIYFSPLPLELRPRARKMREDALFSFPPTQRCKIPLNGWEWRISGLGLHFVFASLFFLIHP